MGPYEPEKGTGTWNGNASDVYFGYVAQPDPNGSDKYFTVASFIMQVDEFEQKEPIW